MKAEHHAIIERAKLANVPPSYLAHDLLVHDLVNAGLFELKNLHSPYNKLNEGQQQEVIERLTEAATKAVSNAIAIISSRNVETIEVEVVDAKFKKKAITVTASIDAQDPNRHGLIDVAGKLCLLVLAPNDYAEGLDFIQPDRDQSDLPLHVSDLTGSLFENKPATKGPDEAGYTTDTGTDELYGKAVAFVVKAQKVTISSIQRELGINFNRAATLVDAMEQNKVISPIDHTGAREVLIQKPSGDSDAVKELPEELIDSIARDVEVDKEFGGFTYEDAAQLLVLKAPKKGFNADWLQSRLAIDSDKASTLLLRLLDNEVIKVDAEGESALTHTYKVTASLEDVA